MLAASRASGSACFHIHERIEAVDGRMQIASSEGKGTKIVLSAPALGLPCAAGGQVSAVSVNP
jgi:hypothetical protein